MVFLNHTIWVYVCICVEGMNEFNCSLLGYDHLALQTSPPSWLNDYMRARALYVWHTVWWLWFVTSCDIVPPNVFALIFETGRSQRWSKLPFCLYLCPRNYTSVSLLISKRSLSRLKGAWTGEYISLLNCSIWLMLNKHLHIWHETTVIH